MKPLSKNSARSKLFSKLPDFLSFFLPLIFCLSLYFKTTPSVITGYADSEELATTAFLNGVAHPPGYSFFTFLLGRLMHLIPLSPIYLGNLINAFFQSLFFGLFGLLSFRLIRLSPAYPSAWLSLSLSSLVSFCLSTSFIYWFTAVRLEVFTFANFLLMLILLLVFLWYQTLFLHSKIRPHLFWLTLCLYGFSLAHLQTLILLGPCLILILFLSRRHLNFTYSPFKTLILASTLFLLAFILPNLILFWQNQHQADFSWYFQPTINGWWRHLTRQDYTGYFPDETVSRAAYWAGLPAHFFTSILPYFKLMVHHFSLPIILLTIFGWLDLFRLHRPLSLFFLVGFLFLGVFLAAFMGFPDYQPNNLDRFIIQSIGERQYLVGFSLFFLSFGLGLNALVRLLQPLTAKPWPTIVVLGLVLLLLSLNLKLSWPAINQANQPFINLYIRSMLSTAVPDSLIVCSADVSCFPLFYLHLVEGLRPDITLLTKSPVLTKYYLLNQTQLFPFMYSDNPDYVANLIAWNIKSKTVYHTNPTDFYIDYLGLNGNPFYLIPHAHLYQISPHLPDTNQQVYPADISDLFLNSNLSPQDTYTRGLLGYFTSLHTLNGSLFLNFGQFSEAKRQFEYAVSLSPDYSMAQQWLLTAQSYTPKDTYASKHQPTFKEYLAQAKQDFATNQLDSAYISARKASYLEPTDLEVRLLLAKILLAGGFSDHAQLELRQVLIFSPQNAEAKSLLQPFFLPSP